MYVGPTTNNFEDNQSVGPLVVVTEEEGTTDSQKQMTCTAFNLTTTSPFLPARTTRIRNPHPTLHRFLHFGFTRPKQKRCRFSPPNATSLELPLLPFTLTEVLVPTESKTLHLYEARYLALLEESLLRNKKFFVHFVLDPIIIDDSLEEASFAARNGCLVFIENVERLEVGALVSIRGIGRVKIIKFLQADPYLKGVVIPVQDRVPDSVSRLSPKVIQVKEALCSLNSLEIKLKAPKEAPLQTQIANSLMWTEKELQVDCDEAFFPSLAERVSFAALQPVSGSSQSELLKLQQEKLKAMELKDTMHRLDNSLQSVKGNISMVAAKLAIQSVEMK